MPAKPAPWYELASVAPLAATAYLGLGPFRGYVEVTGDLRRLRRLGKSQDSTYMAANCAGVVGTQLLAVLSLHGGSVSSEVLASETAGLAPEQLDAELDRLVRAGLVEGVGKGWLRLTPAVMQILVPIGRSLGEQFATTTEDLAGICKNLGIRPIPGRKQERIDAIAGCFADPRSGSAVSRSLSDAARGILDSVAEEAGPDVVPAESVGMDLGAHRWVGIVRMNPDRGSRLPEEVRRGIEALDELTSLGIMGFDEWEGTVWIWREAWPMLRRPLFTTWPVAESPPSAPVADADPMVPTLVATYDRALRHWHQTPPPVLKSGEMRLGKPAQRSAAKALGVPEATVGMIANTALSLGLLLANVVAESGRGRKRTVEEKWLTDPEMHAAWSAASPMARWLRIVAEWVNPTRPAGSEQLVANRHLLLWELASLPAGEGWTDDDAVAAWMEHRYAPMALDEAITECLADLRLLGVVTPSGPSALTRIGRLALEDHGALEALDFGTARDAIVQADMSIICPPGMDVDLLTRIESLASLDSDHGTRTYTLEESRIIDAVRAGDSAESIVEFLEDLSQVAIPDTVYRLVCDAAQRVGQVRVAPATSVLVTEDPVALAKATKLKSAKLTALSATVAVSSLPVDKLMAILDRSGLAPTVTGPGADAVVPRSASARAAELERRAEQHRDLAARTGIDGLAAQAESFEREAAAARNPGSRLAVNGPLAVTPAVLERAGQ